MPTVFRMEPHVASLRLADKRRPALDGRLPVIEIEPALDTGTGQAHQRHQPAATYIVLPGQEARLSLVDTGANLSVIDETLAHSMHLAPFNGPTLRIDGVGSSYTSGWVTLRFHIPATRDGAPVLLATEADFHVMKDFGPKVCIGVDTIAAIEPVFDVATGTATAQGATFPIFDTKGKPLTAKRASRALTAKSNTTIPPRCHAWVPFDAHLLPGVDYAVQSCLWTDKTESLHLAMPSAVIDDSTAAVLLTNFGDSPATIRSNTRLGQALPLLSTGREVTAGAFAMQPAPTKPTAEARTATSAATANDRDEFDSAGSTKGHGTTAPAITADAEPPDRTAEREPSEAEVLTDPDIAPHPIDFGDDPLARLSPDPGATTKVDNIFNVGLGANGEPHPAIVDLLRRHTAAFSLDGTPGHVTADGSAMPIPLIDGKEILPEAPRRYSPEKRQVMDAQIQQLKDWDCIEPSSSPVSFPVLLVKQGEKWRFCVDYRGLNKVSRDDRYPLPRIDDIFEALAGHHWFSGLDAIRGYHQLDIEEADRWKTAFICPSGLYQYKRVPFGLKGAPAWFQRFMDRVLGRLRWLHAVVYLDDVVVFSKTLEEHVDALDTLLTAATKVGLRFSPSKCHFGLRSLALLGRQLSGAGISVQQRKVQAVQDIAAPRTLQELYHVLGLFNYYRDFIPRYAERALPLSRLLRGHRYRRVDEKDKKWSLVDANGERTTASKVKLQWGPTEQASLDDLKASLSSPPTLAFPDYQRPFILYTDASQDAFAAALHQDFPEIAVAFPARPALEQPALLSLEEIREAQQNDPTIAAIRDSLLHNGDDSSEEDGDEHAEAETASNSDDETESETDPDEQPQGPETAEEAAADAATAERAPQGEYSNRDRFGFSLQDGLVVYVGPHRLQRRIYLPKALLGKAFAAAHDRAHFGLAKTIPLLEGLYHPKLVSLLRAYIDNCPPCLRTKTRPRTGCLSLDRAEAACTRPFHSVSMDIVLGLPVSHGLDAILVVVDLFTKTLLTSACSSSITAEGVYELFSRLVLRRGWKPKVIITDSDKRFIGEHGQQFARSIGATLTPSAPHHQQANPVERYIQTLKRVLRALAMRPGGTWVDDLNLAEPAINAAPSLATGYSPDALLYITPPQAATTAPSSASSDDQRKEAEARVEEAVYNLLRQQVEVKRLLSDHRVRLDLPANLQIDPHFDRSHLQLCPRKPDPFGRPLESTAIEAPNDEDEPRWEVDQIVGERLFRGYQQYRVLWKDDPTPTWEFEADLIDDGCAGAIADYKASAGDLPARRRTRRTATAHIADAGATPDADDGDPDGSHTEPRERPSTTERPIAFISTPTSPSEAKLLGLELEMSCLVWALHQLRHYLEGAPSIIVVTDHAPLGAVLRASSRSRRLFTPRIERLRTYIMPFLDSLSFVHRAGKAHGNVDAISRLRHLSN
ncbi:uncharacterized protein PSFLO_02133 [Pseudozyma flocculosa]|uniref:RNA-directed DNA polymerase n=1 Tax=Pseudozyma flocculosa TaxID=84751 RepID=A0A5C3EX61_9BASI|nr:uncharacterized protein PSFLO_02133 [Pseudozyma flocculosa]